ncbi:hypothetical protein [Streptomyces sp. NPDC001678]|uniref:hypothetical protein n=1 Tax=Streptomyces sp. NPDC001678 TaxID=3364599 RepID=UPI0036C5C8A1
MDKRLMTNSLIRTIALGTITVVTDWAMPEGVVRDLAALGAGVLVKDFLLRLGRQDLRVMAGLVHDCHRRSTSVPLVAARFNGTSAPCVDEVTP